MRKIIISAILFAVCVSSEVFAQTSVSAGVVCNQRANITNVRSGPTAKDTEIIDRLPNHIVVEILGRVKNPEGTREWIKVEFKHSQNGAITRGFIHPEGISASCNSQQALATTDTKPPPAIEASITDINNDPIGFKGCDGYKVPLHALTSSRRILVNPINILDIISTDCREKSVTPFLGKAKTYYQIEIQIKTNRTTMFQGSPQKCIDSIIFRGEQRGDDVAYLKGEVIVFSQSFARVIITCDNPYLIQQERERSNKNTAMLVFMSGGKIFYDKTVYEVAEKDKQIAAKRQHEASENQFTDLIEGQPNGQALYLLGGKLERQNDNQKATIVYERVIAKFAATEWAVKANDRLLAMRGDSEARRQASDTQYEISRTRDQASQMCQNRRTACYNTCSNFRSFSERDSCQSGCPLCN